MAATASAPLQDLGPLVFCDHALNLEKQIVLGTWLAIVLSRA
jgi:hypothetical protein